VGLVHCVHLPGDAVPGRCNSTAAAAAAAVPRSLKGLEASPGPPDRPRGLLA